MDTNDNDESAMDYQMTTKMFYHIVMHATLKRSVEANRALSTFDKRIALAYVTLCRVTGVWHEDEQYKRDPRWKLDL